MFTRDCFLNLLHELGEIAFSGQAARYCLQLAELLRGKSVGLRQLVVTLHLVPGRNGCGTSYENGDDVEPQPPGNCLNNCHNDSNTLQTRRPPKPSSTGACV
jgi:hypothetical protein